MWDVSFSTVRIVCLHLLESSSQTTPTALRTQCEKTIIVKNHRQMLAINEAKWDEVAPLY